MLVLAVHRVDAQTARVPLCIILLTDFIKRKALPKDLRARLVLPGGQQSISLWDAPSAEEVQTWCNANLSPDTETTCSEVEEEFAWPGVTSVVGPARAAEKMAEGSRQTLATLGTATKKAGEGIQRKLEELDNRTHILSGADEALTAAKRGAERVVQNERVAAALTSVSSGWGWFKATVMDNVRATRADLLTSPATSAPPHMSYDPTPSTDPYAPAPAYAPAGDPFAQAIPGGVDAPPSGNSYTAAPYTGPGRATPASYTAAAVPAAGVAGGPGGGEAAADPAAAVTAATGALALDLDDLAPPPMPVSVSAPSAVEQSPTVPIFTVDEDNEGAPGSTSPALPASSTAAAPLLL